MCIVIVLPHAVVCIPSGCALWEYIELPSVVQIQYTLDIHGTTITYTTQEGGYCWNRDNSGGCRDYKVQYICPYLGATGQAQQLSEGEILEEDFERVVAAHSAEHTM